MLFLSFELVIPSLIPPLEPVPSLSPSSFLAPFPPFRGAISPNPPFFPGLFLPLPFPASPSPPPSSPLLPIPSSWSSSASRSARSSSLCDSAGRLCHSRRSAEPLLLCAVSSCERSLGPEMDLRWCRADGSGAVGAEDGAAAGVGSVGTVIPGYVFWWDGNIPAFDLICVERLGAGDRCAGRAVDEAGVFCETCTGFRCQQNHAPLKTEKEVLGMVQNVLKYNTRIRLYVER